MNVEALQIIELDAARAPAPMVDHYIQLVRNSLAECTANTAEYGIGRSENIFEGGSVLEIDLGKLRIGFTCSGEFHDRMIRSSDDHDLIAHEWRNAVSDPDRRGSDQGEVKKTL